MGDISQHVNLHARRRSRAGLYGFLMIVVSLGVAAYTLRPRGDPRVVALLGGRDGLATLERPDAVEARRISGAPAPGPDTVHGYPALGGPVEVDAATSSALARALSSPDSYLFDVAKACAFSPGVVVRWRKRTRTLEALLCFACDEVEYRLDGKAVGREDTDPARAALLEAIKPLFPLDAALQALPARGHSESPR